MTALDVSLFAVVLLVAVGGLISLLYAVRVGRHSRDPLRWLLLGVMLSLVLTNVPALLVYLDSTPTTATPPLWVGWAARLAATGVLVGVAWPLLRDTWRELCAYARVAVDSWRFLWNRSKHKSKR